MRQNPGAASAKLHKMQFLCIAKRVTVNNMKSNAKEQPGQNWRWGYEEICMQIWIVDRYTGVGCRYFLFVPQRESAGYGAGGNTGGKYDAGKKQCMRDMQPCGGHFYGFRHCLKKIMGKRSGTG